MSIKVTVHNYLFPIHFTYKGWDVRLEKKMGIFKDVSVEAFFKPSDQFYNDKFFLNGFLTPTEYNLYLSVLNKYISTMNLPSPQTYKFSANGGLMDRFLGQNISATQKVVDKVTEYIDSVLPQIRPISIKEYLSFLANNGLNTEILNKIAAMYLIRSRNI